MKRFQFRRDIGVDAVADDERARIYEVRLAFRFAGAEIEHQTVALLKIHRRAGEIETLVHVKTERAADEKRPVKDRVEPVAVAVRRIVDRRSRKRPRICGAANPCRSKARAPPSAR